MIPSHMSHVSRHRHQEHLDTAARIRDVRQARSEGTLAPDRTVRRRLTAARLAAVMTAVKGTLHL